MRSVFAVAALLMLMWLPARGQQVTPGIHPGGAERTAPILLSRAFTVSMQKHCDEFDGVVRFSAIIDAVGVPQAVKVLEASDRRLVGFAMELIEAQRFKPGMIDGLATEVPVGLTVGLHTCAQREMHPRGDNFYRFALRAHPMIALVVVAHPVAQEAAAGKLTEVVSGGDVGERISSPSPTIVADPAVPISGKLLKRGHCVLGIIVDANGIPQNIHVVRGLDPELDSNAIDAVKSWRFKPALRDGTTPVDVVGTVVATFEYIDKEPVAVANFIPEAPEKVIAANAHDRKLNNTLEPVNADEVIARYMPTSRIAGRILVSLVIDTNGEPQSVHIVKGLDSSLDLDTVAMIEHLRFKPVMKDATTPVAVGIVMPVRYRATVAKPTWRDMFVDSMGLVMIALL